ncbi:unnamed protein product [Closterium sp. NIES-54]
MLERQLHAVKINEGDAVQEAFDQLQDLYVKLPAAGIDYPEKIKCYKALSPLPESWGPLVVNLNGMKDSWSLEWICAQVLQVEFRRKELTAAASEGGGFAYDMKGFKGRGSKKGKAKEGSGGEQYSGGKRCNKGGKRCGGKCWYCHVEGHPWFKCRKLPDGWRPGQPSIEGSKGVHGAMGEGMGSEEGNGGAGGHGGMFYHVGEACFEDMVVLWGGLGIMELQDGCRKLPDGWRPGQPSIEGSKGVHGAMGEGMGSEEGNGGAGGHGGMFYHVGEACFEDMVVLWGGLGIMELQDGAWKILKDVHAPSSEAMVVVLEQQLHAVKINEGDAVQGAFDQLRDLYVKLSATGVDYPEKIKCYKALSLLPESWGPLVVNLNGMKDSWSLQEEFRRKELTAAAGEGGGSAYSMKGFKGRGSKKGKAKEGSGGEQYSGGKRSNKGGKRCGGKCWYCHVEGHPWFKCRKLPDGWRPGQPSIEGSKGVHGAMGEGMGSEEGDGSADGHGGMF